MTKNNAKNLSEKGETRGGIVISVDECQTFCSQIFGVIVVKRTVLYIKNKVLYVQNGYSLRFILRWVLV